MIPDFIDPDAWEGYKAMRKLIKKPMTERAEQMALRKLERFYQQGMDPNAILEQSEFMNWQGLYPLKGESHGRQSASERAFQQYFTGRGGSAHAPKAERVENTEPDQGPRLRVVGAGPK